MKTILILWLASFYIGDSNNPADSRGAIAWIEFDSPAACRSALHAVAEKSKRIDGICVPKGSIAS